MNYEYKVLFQGKTEAETNLEKPKDTVAEDFFHGKLRDKGEHTPSCPALY